MSTYCVTFNASVAVNVRASSEAEAIERIKFLMGGEIIEVDPEPSITPLYRNADFNAVKVGR